MNMNDKPFADWSWKNQQSTAPRSNVLAPLGSGSMEQAPPSMSAAPAPVQPSPIESYAMSKGVGGAENVVEGAIKGMSAAPLAAGTTAGAIAPGMSQSAMLASQTAGMGATGLTGATGAGLGTAGINAAAGGAAGAGAGASAALAAMGPIGWAGLGLMGGKALGLFNDGTTNVPKGYMNGTPQVGGK
jgi:hypothetical protein